MSTLKIFAAALIAVLLLATEVSAQSYPSRPIKIIVPAGPGVSPDIVSRLVADQLAKRLGQPVVVDNRPGASGLIGAKAAAESAPDGYTLFFGFTGLMSMYPHLYPKSDFRPLNEFAPVSHILNTIFVVTAAPDAPFNSLAELAAFAKNKPGEVNFGSAGPASHSRVATELIAAKLGIKLTHVSYKSDPGVDVMAGRVQLYLDPLVTAAPLVKAGKVKALAVTSSERASLLPDVPTISESIPGFSSYAIIGFYAPKSTPVALLDRLAKEISEIVKTPEVRKQFEDLGYAVVGTDRAEFDNTAKNDYDFWGKVIKDAGITLE